MSKSISFKTAYGPKFTPGLSFEGELTLTQQSDKDSCDINRIMAPYIAAGVVPHFGDGSTPFFGEFSDGNDFQEKLNCVLTAQESFMSLDANIRSRFLNDPSQLLNFLSNPENREEAERLGLVEKISRQASPAIPDSSQDESGAQGST